jgi:hypothetical protein
MAESVEQQMERLQQQLQNLQAQLQSRQPATKDLYLVSLIPKWAGNEKAVPLQEFFNAVEGSARVGNWSDADKIQVAVLKLTESARAFYNASSELHATNVTWESFKKAFQTRFRYVRTDQFHFNHLQMARQKKGETPQEFADRLRNLARRTVPQVENPDVQKLYYEQAEGMLLACFTSGLAGTPGRQTRYAMPKNLEEALKIAITVEEAELQERREQAFYVKTERFERRNVDRRNGSEVRGDRKGTRPKRAASSRPWRGSSESTEGKSQNSETRKCYVCGGIGHLARACPSRQGQKNSTVPSKGHSWKSAPRRDAKLKSDDRKKPSGPKDGQSSGNAQEMKV